MNSQHSMAPDNPGDGRSIDTPWPPSDLERNPGIGGSRGSDGRTGVGPNVLDGDINIEGDMMNDTAPTGTIAWNKRGRTRDWLAAERYVTGGVWQDIRIEQWRIGAQPCPALPGSGMAGRG